MKFEKTENSNDIKVIRIVSGNIMLRIFVNGRKKGKDDVWVCRQGHSPRQLKGKNSLQ